MVIIGRSVPKGFRELPGSIHLGRGVWAFAVEPEPEKRKPAKRRKRGGK